MEPRHRDTGDHDATTPPERSRTWAVAAASVAWLVGAVGGTFALTQYASTAGAASSPPTTWPVESGIAPAGTLPTLLMVAHPRCSCTRASIGELARLMPHLEGRVRARVLFARPPGSDTDWSKTDLWTSAARIPGVEVVDDAGGREAERFGVHTSGGIVLYAAAGQLLFHGGITPARSHFGDSAGRRRILELVDAGETDQAHSDVYGCAVRAPSEERPQ